MAVMIDLSMNKGGTVVLSVWLNYLAFLFTFFFTF